MEETQVIIVGAGPAGLALGLSLAKLQVHSIILEKETEITTDPRGVYLTADAVRILFDLGLGDKLASIGHEVPTVNYHKGSFNEEPFFQLNIGSGDPFHHALPGDTVQIQPKLEEAMNREIDLSKWCTLRRGCRVTDMISDVPPVIVYVDSDDTRHEMSGKWLVGADGKKGIVRKYFLEPKAGIKQETGIYDYEGTWVASNLRISLPTPETHPELPLWELGYSPEDVYDIFWPQGWHFCSPPYKATAAGRFGPRKERLWRHEFRQDDAAGSMDVRELFWEHLAPMITLKSDKRGHDFPEPVQFPKDCIEVMRCRPFTFVHKVVNSWFSGRSILIGDAAHVYPPFAGQGIASGLRDAHQLAWRLAILVSTEDQVDARASKLLGAWAAERRRSVDDSAFLSMLNGRLCNNAPSFLILLILQLHMLIERIPFLPSIPDLRVVKDAAGFASVKQGFVHKEFKGGFRLPQIYIQSSSDASPFRSDRLLGDTSGLFTVLVITGTDAETPVLRSQASEVIEKASVDPRILSQDSVAILQRPRCVGADVKPAGSPGGMAGVYSVTPRSGLAGDVAAEDYDEHYFTKRLGTSTKFAVLRPDFFVFSCASDARELEKCLGMLKDLS